MRRAVMDGLFTPEYTYERIIGDCGGKSHVEVDLEHAHMNSSPLFRGFSLRERNVQRPPRHNLLKGIKPMYDSSGFSIYVSNTSGFFLPLV